LSLNKPERTALIKELIRADSKAFRGELISDQIDQSEGIFLEKAKEL